MDGTKSSTYSQVLQLAPFVEKTYEMVSDPRTDSLIRWGRENNSFLVLDPSHFSQLLLSFYFKHNNFSSFIRQLNTYGFRKVDPDHWEFAHESFLRGQFHLLPLIVRRKKANDANNNEVEDPGQEEKETLLEEIRRLRREQKSMEEELDSMSKRLLATERRPQQMVSFLMKVAEDPEFLPRLVVAKKQQQREQQQQQQQQRQTVTDLADKKNRQQLNKEKKARIFMDSSSLCPLPQEFCNRNATSSEDFRSGNYSYFSYGDDVGVSTDLALVPIEQAAAAAAGADSQIVMLPEFRSPDAEKIVAYPFSLLGHILF